MIDDILRENGIKSTLEELNKISFRSDNETSNIIHIYYNLDNGNKRYLGSFETSGIPINDIYHAPKRFTESA